MTDETSKDAAVQDASKSRDATVDAGKSSSQKDTGTDPAEEDATVDEQDSGQDGAEDASVAGDDASTSGGSQDAAVHDAGSKADAGHTATDAGQTSKDAGSANTCDTLTYDSFGKSFMDTYCVSCHGPANAQKNVHLDTLAGVTAAKSKVKSEVQSNAMPPLFQKAPSASERTQLQQWIDCGPK